MKDSENIRQFPRKASKSASNGLTGIPSSIHCPATQYPVEAGNDELERLAVDNFLNTLAEIAISIAAREAEANKERDD